MQPGAFGENLCTTGWTEADVCIGDVMRFVSAILQISQGRQPCWKLNKRFGQDDMAFAGQSTGRTGWYYRILEEGIAKESDELILDLRPQPDWQLSPLSQLLCRRTDAHDELRKIVEIPELAEGWRRLAARRVETAKVEDWSNRLNDRKSG